MNRMLFVAIVVGMLGFVSTGPRATGQPLSASRSSAAPELSVPAVVEKTAPCIYRVEVRGIQTKLVGVGKDRTIVKKEFISTGTGFSVTFFDPAPLILGPKKVAGRGETLGYVVTNSHVVIKEGFAYSTDAPPTIRLRNEKYKVDLEGELVGHDPLSDLAVIRVTDWPQSNAVARLAAPEFFNQQGRLRALSFANPAGLKVGQDVVAVGYALGLDGRPTVSKGIVSALNRTEAGGEFSGLVQTEASINSGNSGGPLLNTRGEVVGVNTFSRATIIELQLDLNRLREFINNKNAPDGDMKQGDTLIIKEGSTLLIGAAVNVTQGINFARSCESAEPIVARLIRTGKVERPALGIAPRYNFVGAAEQSGLRLPAGVIMGYVRAGSPAAKAGLKFGDIITEVESIPVHSLGDLNTALAVLPVKEEYKVNYFRPSPLSTLALMTGKRSLTEEERLRAAREERVGTVTLQIGK